MSYYLRIRTTNKGKYLAIYDSGRVKGISHNKSKVYKTLGYEDALKTPEMPDPITYYREECKRLNLARNEMKSSFREIIGEENYVKNYGYYLPKAVFNSLHVRELLTTIQKATSKYKCDCTKIMEDLIYARIFSPKSKSKTYKDVLNEMYLDYDYSLDDIYNTLYYCGENYDTIIAVITNALKNIYQPETSNILFDCTNFYFEIDREDDFRKKGPSKENRRDPLVSMALLLDSNAMPINMKIFPGNESEKPQLRQIIDEMKLENRIEGRTIQIADKGLNCAKNIYSARLSGDGYLFSKSIKQLNHMDKVWLSLTNQMEEVTDEAGNVAYKIKSAVDDYTYEFYDDNTKKISFKTTERRVLVWNPSLEKKKREELNKLRENLKYLIASKAKREMYNAYADYIDLKAFDKNGEIIESKIGGIINHQKIDQEYEFAGYNMLVTSEVNLDEHQIYHLYHKLRQIEESFRIMKTDLDARPVYLQRKQTITGHFLIVYLSVLLLRILQFVVFKKKTKLNTILDLIRNSNCIINNEFEVTNLLRRNEHIDAIIKLNILPKTAFYKTIKRSEIKTLLALSYKKATKKDC